MVHSILFDLIKKHKWDEFISKLNELDETFDINIRDTDNNYFLTYAILFNKYDIVKLLIDRNAKIDITDQEGQSILYMPIKYGYTDILELLLNANDNNIGLSIVDIKDNKFMKIPLHYAIVLKNIKAIHLLIKHGSNTNITDKFGYNALHLAIYSRNIDICKYIINNISNINAKCETGETALHIACNLQLVEIVELLLKQGINVDAQDYNHEFTALHYSVHLNNKEIVMMLIKHGAQINMQDTIGNTAIHYAIIDDYYEIFKMMMSIEQTKYITNVNLWNIDGEIPLHIVLKNQMFESNYLNMMIDKSNLTLQDNEGNSCLFLMLKHKIWKKHIDNLIPKRLDIMTPNIYKVRPIDNIAKGRDYDKFINLVAESYYYRLHRVGYEWTTEWENNCGTDKNDKNKCIDMIKSKLIKMIEKNTVTCLNQSFPVKNKKLCVAIGEETKNGFCTFTGSTLDILIGLLYLLKKYPDACSTLTKKFADNKDICSFYKSLGLIMNNKCEFLNFEIIWVNQKIYFTEGFQEKFKLCTNNDKKRFVIIPIGIELKDGSHANYIIYDKKKGEVERFEPHGATTPMGLNYNPNLFDDILETKFKSIDETIKYIRPKEYLPKIGFQMLDMFENNRKKIGDPSGFCALWSIWYVDMRLLYKDVDRVELVETLIRTVKKQSMSFKNLIRNYGENIIIIRDNILKKSKMDINDWLNDQYTDAQMTTIMNSLMNEIENIL